MVKSMRLRVRLPGLECQHYYLQNYVTLGKVLNIPGPQFHDL